MVVYENMYPGWQAWRDGTPVDLLSNDWLVVDAPPGEHVYNFRYRPWDAAVGLILTVLGLSLAAGLTLLPDTGRADRLMEVFTDMLNEEGAEICLKPIEEYVVLGEPVNFYTLVEAARRRKETAFGYRIVSEHEDEARSFGVHINPEKSASVKFETGDRIIVFAD